MVIKVMAVQNVSFSARESQSPKEWAKRKSSNSFEKVLDKIIKAKVKVN